MLAHARLQTIIRCSCRAVAETFYVGTLGLPLIRRTFNGLIVDCGGTDLCLCEDKDIQLSGHAVAGFAVADIAAAVADLMASGVHLERIEGMRQDDSGVAIAPDGSGVGWFRDPDGNFLSVVQYACG